MERYFYWFSIIINLPRFSLGSVILHSIYFSILVYTFILMKHIIQWLKKTVWKVYYFKVLMWLKMTLFYALLLIYNLAEYIILSWKLFSFRILKALFHCVQACDSDVEKSQAFLISNICIWPILFSLEDFRITSLPLCFWNFNYFY